MRSSLEAWDKKNTMQICDVYCYFIKKGLYLAQMYDFWG